MYNDLDSHSWEQVQRTVRGPWPPPKTVHLPIQPAHSPDFIYVDCAFNAYRLRVLPDILNSDSEKRLAARQQETFLIGFAFDDPPFIPDFQCSEMSLADGRWPVATVTYFAWDIYYQLEYSCRQLDPQQSLLQITGRLRNEDDKPRTGTIRVRLDFQPESDFFPYHYVPFYWDLSCWQAHGPLENRGSMLLRHGQPVGRIEANQFKLEYEPRTTVFQDDDYNREFSCSRPYFAAPSLRLRNPGETMRLCSPLAAGEEKTFQVLMLTNYEKTTAQHRQELSRDNPETGRKLAVDGFRGQLPAATAKLVCKAEKLEEIFSFLSLNNLQLLVRHPGRSELMPVQGGSSERHFVWVWEAVCSILPLLSTGHFQSVRESLDFIFKLQDAGCPPIGNFTDTEGAIGTTGPRWMCTTGSALGLAAEYYRFTSSDDFLAGFLPRILKAGHWILRQIRSTRRLGADQKRPPTYGLMPAGRATDGDVGYVIAFSDAWTFWGLTKTVQLLEKINHPEAAVFRAEQEVYRQDLQTAIAAIARSDGYIPRKIDTEEEEIIARKFINICNSASLAYTGVLDPGAERFEAFAQFVETNVVDWFFHGVMDREVTYIGTNECQWHDIYLRRGEWKKAYAALQANLQYGMTRDTHLCQERFSRRNPAYTPWQPNASANGRLLSMIIKSFYLETDNEAIVAGCIPFAWLRENRITELSNLHTPGGALSLLAEMINDSSCRLTLTALKDATLPQVIRFPEHFLATSELTAITGTSQRFKLPENSVRAVFSLHDAEKNR